MSERVLGRTMSTRRVSECVMAVLNTYAGGREPSSDSRKRSAFRDNISAGESRALFA